MSTRISGLSRYASLHADHVLPDDIVSFWNEIRTTEEIGVTTWDVIEELERQVTDCLVMVPPDIGKAVSLTFKAKILIAGLNDL